MRLRARGLCPLVSGLLRVRGRGVGRSGGSAYGLRFTPRFPFFPAPLIARVVGRVWGVGGAGARCRAQLSRCYDYIRAPFGRAHTETFRFLPAYGLPSIAVLPSCADP